MNTTDKPEQNIEELKNELMIERNVNKLMFSLIIQSLDAISAKKNVREVMTQVMKESVPEQIASVPSAHEIIKRVEKIIQKK